METVDLVADGPRREALRLGLVAQRMQEEDRLTVYVGLTTCPSCGEKQYLFLGKDKLCSFCGNPRLGDHVRKFGVAQIHVVQLTASVLAGEVSVLRLGRQHS